MHANAVFAASALLSLVAAVPLAKRDIFWVTETREDVVTVPVTTTVWLNPGESVPTADAAATLSHYGHHHPHYTAHEQPPATTAAASSPSAAETSAPAPAPSTSQAPPPSSPAAPTTPTSAYVAPTTTAEAAPATPTSTYVAPATTSTPPAAPASPSTPSSAPAAPTTTAAAAPAPAVSSSSTSGSALTGDAASGTSYTGDLTYYADGLGACGWTNGPDEHIVAIAESLFDEYTPASGNPNNNPLCGKTVTITGKDGNAYSAKIVDRCTGCKKQDLDLTQSYFNLITNNGDGRVSGMSWKFD